jgi:hypothetical protein
LKPAWLAAVLSSVLPTPPPGSIPVDTADHDADEVARELKALRAEYVREGVLRDD